MHVVCLAFCPHSNQIVGAAHDAFDPEVIVSEFKRLQKIAEDEADGMSTEPGEEEKDDDDDDDANEETPDIEGKHYMVMMVTTWSGKTKSSHFVAARYVLQRLSSRWLRRNVRDVVSFLATFNFYITGYAFDGASENRSWMKHTLKIPLKDVLPELLYDEEDDEEEEEETKMADEQSACEDDYRLDGRIRKFKIDELPWDMNVACWHHVMTDVIVVALGDFSHGIKKQCNGLERGNLELNGKPMTLQMLKDCWEKGPDASGTEGSIMLFRGITREAFEKNSKNRMNVSLAAKVQSKHSKFLSRTFSPSYFMMKKMMKKRRRRPRWRMSSRRVRMIIDLTAGYVNSRLTNFHGI